jgi:hypothetical protein
MTSTDSRTHRVTHLTLNIAMVEMDINYGESEDCSESRMGSITSQGASEWSV